MESTKAATLISATCSRSWLDQINGELWLCPDGLLRRSLGLMGTLRTGMGQSVDPTNRSLRQFTRQEITQLMAAGRGNRWIPWESIARAHLSHRAFAASLQLELVDGRRERLLWMRVDGGELLLAEALVAHLSSRFTTSVPIEAPGAGPVPADWPVTIVAQWKHSGTSLRELTWWTYLLLGVLWVVGSQIFLERRLSGQASFLVLLVGGMIAWSWLRRRPSHLELVLRPDRLRIRDLRSGEPGVEIQRDDAGRLLAAETGLDWRERRVTLTDNRNRRTFTFQAGLAQVRFSDTALASQEWWRSTMPTGTALSNPPTHLPVLPLVAEWWPSDRRWSVRGNAGVIRGWLEGSLPTYAAWDRRQQRNHALVAAMGLGAFLVPVLVGGNPNYLIGLGLPLVAGLVLALRAAFK